MTTATAKKRTTETSNPWAKRGDGADWAALTDEVNDYGCALMPRLLTPEEWPSTLDEWLKICHEAGQTRPTPILLRYREGDWNALHRDLYGDKVFPLIPQGHGLIFTTRDRPVESKRGWSASPVRHGVSAIRSGGRHTLGLVFHDAA